MLSHYIRTIAVFVVVSVFVTVQAACACLSLSDKAAPHSDHQMHQQMDHAHMQHDQAPEPMQHACGHCEDGVEKATIKTVQNHQAAKTQAVSYKPVLSTVMHEGSYATVPKAYQMRRWRDPPARLSQTPITLKIRLLT